MDNNTSVALHFLSAYRLVFVAQQKMPLPKQGHLLRLQFFQAAVILSSRPCILFRLLLELLLAVRRAEVVLLPAILGFILRIILVNLHSTNRIVCHIASSPV
jgi:hypothetical protein